MARFAIRLLLAAFAVLLIFGTLRSSLKWPSQLVRWGTPASEGGALFKPDVEFALGPIPPPLPLPEQKNGKQEVGKEKAHGASKEYGPPKPKFQPQSGVKHDFTPGDDVGLLPDASPGNTPEDSPKPRTRWGKLKVQHPIEKHIQLPSSAPRELPQIQHAFTPETPDTMKVRRLRLNTVRNAFRHDWEGYRRNAWTRDELRPLTAGFDDSFGGWGATLVDSLDTLWIMRLYDDFDEAVAAVEKIDFTKAKIEEVNVFETAIRFLGGLLSAYDLSGMEVLLEKAVEVGEMLYVAFDTPNRMPVTRWAWKKAMKGEKQTAGSMLLAELGSMTLEFTHLSQLTGDAKYYDAVERITEMLKDQQDKTKLPGLWPLVCDAQKKDCTGSTEFSLGAMADSTYEYLAKEYIMLGGHGEHYRTMYEKAISTAKSKLFFRPQLPENRDVLMSGIWRSSDDDTTGKLIPEGQHLSCFLGGMVAVGSKIFGLGDLETARKLTESCIWAYDATKRGIMPEVYQVAPCTTDPCNWDDFNWREAATAHWKSRTGATKHDLSFDELHLPKGMIAVDNPAYLLRPEAIESIFIMYRITGDPEWMDKGWKMFKKIEQYTHSEVGHAALVDVTTDGPQKTVVMDKMESYWMAETLKYFYLLFCEPNYISLDRYVFNTEAHPFLRPGMTSRPGRPG